jgi:hypothetical protein
MLYVLILHLQEILGTLLRNTQTHTNMDDNSDTYIKKPNAQMEKQ